MGLVCRMSKAAGQMSFEKVRGWGGKRPRAGRPGKSGQVSHGKRPSLNGSTPVHVTWRLRADSLNLRCGEVSEVFKASALGAKKCGLRILHYSIQGNHLNIMAEASGNSDLYRGLRSFVVRFSKGVKRIVSVRGPLFAGRYHLHVLKTPTEVKRALAYILQNFSKHAKLIWHLDEFSSAPFFGQWSALLGLNLGPLLKDKENFPDLPMHLSRPRSWLAREGWLRGRG